MSLNVMFVVKSALCFSYWVSNVELHNGLFILFYMMVLIINKNPPESLIMQH